MIIPEDGSLPKITRTGFTPFNNVMVVKLSKHLEEKGKTLYNLITLDSSKKGERWPAESCSKESTEIPKESNVSKLPENKVYSTNTEKSKVVTMNKQRNPRKKVLQKRLRNSSKKFVKKNITEAPKYHYVQADQIHPWLPLPHPTYNTIYNLPLYKAPLLNLPPSNNGLLGNAPNDLIKTPLISKVPLINTNDQSMISRNIVPANLPTSECHGNREMPLVNSSFDNTYTNFANKLPSDKYDHRFNDSYRDNSSYCRNYNNTERDESSVNPRFRNRFDSHLGGSYDPNYVQNPVDPSFRNHSYDDFDANHMTRPSENYAQSCGVDPITNGNFGEDIPYNGYNEMPRNNYSEYTSFQNDFRNNSGDKQRNNLNEGNYMRSNRDYNSNLRGSNDGSPLNNSYDNYPEMHRENSKNFYGEYENGRTWDNGREPNQSFHDNYRRDRKPFYKRNKNTTWRKNSSGNARQSPSARGRNNYRRKQ